MMVILNHHALVSRLLLILSNACIDRKSAHREIACSVVIPSRRRVYKSRGIYAAHDFHKLLFGIRWAPELPPSFVIDDLRMFQST